MFIFNYDYTFTYLFLITIVKKQKMQFKLLPRLNYVVPHDFLLLL